LGFQERIIVATFHGYMSLHVYSLCLNYWIFILEFPIIELARDINSTISCILCSCPHTFAKGLCMCGTFL